MRILSQAGGGFMGIGPASFLGMAEGRLGSTFLDKVGCFAGTSVGAINAALMASGMSAGNVAMLHVSLGREFFGNKLWAWKLLKKGPRYGDKGLNAALRKHLPMLMGDLRRTLLVTAWNPAKRDLEVFCSDDPTWALLPVWEAVRASMAAPTYFAPWDGYLDGGLGANDPAWRACTTMKRMGHDPAEMSVLDLVTTGTTEESKPPPAGAGAISVLTEQILPAITSGNSSEVAEDCTAWVGKYIRVAPKMPAWDLDDYGKADKCADIWMAENTSPVMEWIHNAVY